MQVMYSIKSECPLWSLNWHMLQNIPLYLSSVGMHRQVWSSWSFSKWLMAGFISLCSDATACSFCCERLMQVTGNDMWACASAYHQTRADRWAPFLTLVSLTALYPAGAHSSARSLCPWALQVLANGAQRVWLGLLSSLCCCCQKSVALRGDLIKAGVLRWTVILECMG